MAGLLEQLTQARQQHKAEVEVTPEYQELVAVAVSRPAELDVQRVFEVLRNLGLSDEEFASDVEHRLKRIEFQATVAAAGDSESTADELDTQILALKEQLQELQERRGKTKGALAMAAISVRLLVDDCHNPELLAEKSDMRDFVEDRSTEIFRILSKEADSADRSEKLELLLDEMTSQAGKFIESPV